MPTSRVNNTFEVDHFNVTPQKCQNRQLIFTFEVLDVERDIESSLFGSTNNAGHLGSKPCSLVKIVSGDEFHSRISHHLLCLVYIRSLQSDNNGGGEIEIPGGGDDALRDHVAPHDPTEDVHKESVHFWVPSDDFESLFHLVGSGTAANVEEVGWGAAVQLDDVHGGHGKPSSVNHAAEVAGVVLSRGVDFNHGSILVLEELVQVEKD